MSKTKQEIKERPILFSGEMVRAILAGTKTQTRRVVKPQTLFDGKDGIIRRFPNQHGLCPFGAPGDRLWVRENFWVVERVGQGVGNQFLIYDEEWKDGMPDESAPLRPFYMGNGFFGHKPSIHMPRWASRITLEIVSVRVQRLQDISEEDAKAEGVKIIDHPDATYKYGFEETWGFINGEKHPWESNPWVWAIEFRRVSNVRPS